MSATIGALYFALGEAYRQEAVRSAASLRAAMPGLPITLFTDAQYSNPLFEAVRQIPAERQNYFGKVWCLGQSPYAHTLYLDSDTYIAESLADVLALLEVYDVVAARTTHYLLEAAWWRPEMDLAEVAPGLIEPNGGLLAYRTSPVVAALLADWLARCLRYETQIGLRVDQPSLKEALYYSPARLALLTPEYNLRIMEKRGEVYGRVRVLHGRHPNLAALAQRINKISRPRAFGWRFGRLWVRPQRSQWGYLWRRLKERLGFISPHP